MHDQKLFRLALRLHEVIRRNQIERPFNDLTRCMNSVRSNWREMKRCLRLTSFAIERDWRHAARTLVSDNRFCRDDFAAGLKDLSEAAAAVTSPKPHHCSVQSLLDDLVDLQEGFKELRWNRDELWVRTEAITLEEIYLGPFEIRMPIACLGTEGGNEDFKVNALDPQPSSKSDEVVHPHVEASVLCTGDGTVSIGRAMADGRILDLFQLIHAILTTYNPDSAYVRLDHWNRGSLSCADCGYDVDEDETLYCQSCQSDFCQECTYGCGQCAETVCRGCSIHCPLCEMRYCQRCTSTCAQCERVVCRDCINDQGLCESCQEKQAQEGKPDDDNQVRDAGVQAVSTHAGDGEQRTQLQEATG